MICQNSLKQLIESMECADIQYYVYGGLAVEGLRGQISRDHGDVDIIAPLSERDLVVEVLTSSRFEGSFSLGGTRYKATNGKLSADILFFTEEPNMVRVFGVKAEQLIPADILAKSQTVILGDVHFRSVPLECLLESIVYFDNERDRRLLLAHKPKIPDEQVRRIKRVSRIDSSDPKNNVYEHRKRECGLTVLVDPSRVRPGDWVGSINHLESEIDRVSMVEPLYTIRGNNCRLYRHRGVYFRVMDIDMGKDIAGFNIFSGQTVNSKVLSTFVQVDVFIDLNISVPEEFKGPILAHEIAEAFYSNNGCREPDAHLKGLQAEAEYLARYLEESQEEYLRWSKKVRPVPK